MTYITRERREEIRKRIEAATPGPWVRWEEHSEVFCNNDGENTPSSITGNSICECDKDDLPEIEDQDPEVAEELGLYQEQAEANAEFIAHSRTDNSDLLEAYEDVIKLAREMKELAGDLIRDIELNETYSRATKARLDDLIESNPLLSKITKEGE